MKVIGVIPARYKSSRFPGKPLADICGKPMIWWVYQQAKKAGKLDEVYVATDDKRIYQVCTDCSIKVVMTGEHKSSASRIAEFADIVPADYYVQINGDEPLIDVRIVEAVIPDVIPLEEAFATNVITEIDDPAQVMDPSNIKMVFDEQFNALYMSRTPIPYPFKSITYKYHKHVGVLGYNRKMLDFIRNSEPGRFESIEGIDTLRMIDYGKRLQLVYVPNCHSLSVDTPKDLEEVIHMIHSSQGV